MKRILMWPAVAAALLGVAGVIGTGVASAADPTPIKVEVGGGEPGYAVTQFLPSNVTVQTGATVNFEFAWYEVHHIAMFQGQPPADEPTPDTSPATFPNDKNFVFSGDIVGDPAAPTTFSIKFTKAGTYDYHCFIHPNMDGVIQVVDADSAGAGNIDNQLSVDARAKAQYNSSILQLKDIAAGTTPAADETKPGGGKLVNAIMGSFDVGLGQSTQFFPATINIREGDSVRWTETDQAPHDVVFGTPQQADPFSIEGKATGTTYSGGDLESPIVSASEDFGPATLKSYEVVFTKAGTYHYICLLHADQGMQGTIVVAARGGTAPLPPNTGTGTGDQTGLNGWYIVIGAILLAAGVGGATAVRARR